MNIIISSKDKDYNGFMRETLDELEQHKVKGIALVALLEDHHMSGYWNMDLYDILEAENVMRFEALDRFILANRERYVEGTEEEEEER